ncbi:RING finger protein 37 isoform X1 [Seriola aureovittata]|uniref:RING finger protein 37 isoform X1 n=1 Tax=Seriola aureovittata TaxID=2871759 RepID=UPI0024BDD3CB|nr:RING finger protein 37 isoform X1 [Seriola aureovittata]XP_056233206.1 RING finger protein 37 isoform X1 [Seriola aureovittata]
MVVNLCLPQFYTTVHCNKLCADGYDVTNLVSADPAVRRRGFKLEYFLRPPVQVTLKFGFQVELCRVDVELWPWGMDRGQACKRLEISTSSDSLALQNFSQGPKQVDQKEQMQVKDQSEQNKNKREYDSKSCQSNGHQWSLQAQQWGEETLDGRQHKGHAYKRQMAKEHTQTNAESSQPEAEFRLVGRCELKEETQVCFSRSNFSPRPPFLSPPPPQPANCRQEELWSRGLLSLGAVTQLRVTVPFGGAASALGLKALTVWGQPARCCPAEDVERIKSVHEASVRQLPRTVFFAPSVRHINQPLQAATPPSSLSIPEEFLDPITQEVMTLPMLLPSGVSVDNTTLEEYQKREATWGRAPNDPFTGVPFTSNCQPLPNPQLKTRIDHFLLQRGDVRRDGMLGRQGEGENPQASRLIPSKVDGQSQNSTCISKSSINNTSIQYNAGTRNTKRTAQIEDTGLGHSSDNGNHTTNSQPLTTDGESELDRRKKRSLSGISKESTEELTTEKQLLPQTKRPRNAAVSAPSCSSHEQRLSASLDEALFSALQGRPSFTSNLSQQRRVAPDSEPVKTTQQFQSSGSPSVCTGEKTCSACSCSVSAYSTSVSSIYRLTCSHLLCHACLRRHSNRLNSVTAVTSSHILCPACQSPTPRSDIIRVHH